MFGAGFTNRLSRGKCGARWCPDSPAGTIIDGLRGTADGFARYQLRCEGPHCLFGPITAIAGKVIENQQNSDARGGPAANVPVEYL